MKERVKGVKLDLTQVGELVGTKDRQTDAAWGAGEVGCRYRRRAGPGAVEAADGGGGEGLGQGVGHLVGGGHVYEAERACVDHFVAKPVVAGVDVGALAAVGEDVGAELDTGLVVFQERRGVELGMPEVAEERAHLKGRASGVVGGRAPE